MAKIKDAAKRLRQASLRLAVEDAMERAKCVSSESRFPANMVLFPGWDDAMASEEELAISRAVRRAAEAILAQGLAPDEGSPVSRDDLGHLVRYIADMLGD